MQGMSSQFVFVASGVQARLFSLGGFKYYHSETGAPDPRPCPRSSKVCWFIHPNEPEWNEIGGGGGMSSSPPKRHGRGRRSPSPRRRGRSRSRSRSRSQSRSRGGRGKSRSRTRSDGRYVSPGRKRPRLSSPPPRRPLYERIQRSKSPRPRSRSRPRSYSPRHRRPLDRRPRPRTPTPISSSRGHTPPKRSSPQTVKVEPPTEIVPSVPSNTVDSTASNMNASAVGDQPPVPPRVSTDRNHHQVPPSLSLTLGEHATATSPSPQLPPPPSQADPFSPVFAPETPVIPGLSASVPLSQPQFAALQRSLALVIRDQTANPTATQPPTVLPSVNPMTPIPATASEVEKTEIWTTRVKCVKLASFVKEIVLFTDAFFGKLS